jgi:hypothetical protein
MPSRGSAERSNRPRSLERSNSNSSDTHSATGRKLRKRKRSRIDDSDELRYSHEGVSELSTSDGLPAPKQPKKLHEVPLTCVRPPPLAFPKSLYEDAPPMPMYAEADLLRDILVFNLKFSSCSYYWLIEVTGLGKW